MMVLVLLILNIIILLTLVLILNYLITILGLGRRAHDTVHQYRLALQPTG